MSGQQTTTAHPAEPGAAGAMPPTDEGVSDTNDGFIVGVDPKTPTPTAEEWGQVETEVSQSQQPPVQFVEEQQQQPVQQGLSEAEKTLIEQARREEKDKLYGEISSMKDEMKTLREEREARETAEREALEAVELERKKTEEEAMEAKELLERRSVEWEERFTSLQGEIEQRDAIMEQERRFQELENYRQEMIEQNQEYIMPELRDLVVGNNEEEIAGSVEELKSRTANILSSIADATTQQRQSMRAASPNQPPVGPMENQQEYQQYTPENIRDMDMNTYRKNRGRLIPAASEAYRRGGGF